MSNLVSLFIVHCSLIIVLCPSVGFTQRQFPIREVVVIELVGINEQVAADQYSASVAITISGSGEIRKVCIISSGGAILTPAMTLILMDADPATATADTTITLAERQTIFAKMALASTDYRGDTVSTSNCQDVNEVYHDFGGAAFVLFQLNTAETQINSLVGDDELIELHLWYKREIR